MLNYEDRIMDAFNQIPTHRQKGILEDLEHKAYTNDYEEEIIKEVSVTSEKNILEPIANWLYEAISGIPVLIRLIKNKK